MRRLRVRSRVQNDVGPRISECEQSLEAAKGKEVVSPLKSPRGTQPVIHFGLLTSKL